MKSIRIQLECPYNSSNETKNTNVWVFTFLYSLHKQCTFLYISTCARGREHKCAISFIQQCRATRCFIPWMNQFLNVSSEPVIPFSGLVSCFWFVSIESAVLNESFDMNDSVSHLLKQGLAATYWFYCHIYLSMTDLNHPRCQHKNTFSKILFNYQYWPKFLYFRPQKGKKLKNNGSFNKDFSLNRNLF